ncbi:MAG: hypothetical protein MI922_19155, partial [Bacteroidales bacterium]|nr:hypothetical protein [Bacteroidales bacterium]
FKELPGTSSDELLDTLSRVKKETHSYKVGVFMKVYSESQAKNLLLNVYERGLNDVKKKKSELQLEDEKLIKKKKKKDKSAKRKKDSLENLINSTSKTYHRNWLLPFLLLIICAGLIVPMFFKEKLFVRYNVTAIVIASLNFIVALWISIVPAATVKNGYLKIHVDLGRSKLIDLKLIEHYDIHHRGRRLYLTLKDGSVIRVRLTHYSKSARKELVKLIKSIAKLEN